MKESVKKTYFTIRSAVQKITDDQVWPYSAQAAFYMLLSFFPFLMFLLSILRYLTIFTQDELVNVFSMIMPKAIMEYVVTFIDEVYDMPVTLLSISVVVVLWYASRGIIAIIEGLNRVYETKETRNYFHVRLMGIFYTLLFVLAIILLLGLFVFGNTISGWISAHMPTFTAYTVHIMNWRLLVGITFMAFIFLLMYKFLPNRKTSLIKEIPGAVLAAFGWVAFSFLFSFYIDNLNNMSAVFGSLTTAVFCMLWLQFCLFILFMGAELNRLLFSERFIHLLKLIKLFVTVKKRDHHKKKSSEKSDAE